MTKDFYVTTPIYYVNDSPHIGHAYTTIAADVMARFKRLDGYDVKFTTGTDEHGQKVAKAAEKAGIDPQSFTDDVSQRFKNLTKSGDNLINITNDDFVRTTEERHKKAAQELWKRIKDNGHIYKDTYGGWYAVRDEAYYQESELIEKDGKQLAPTGAEVEWVEEESYFFDLSKWQEPLLKLYDENPDWIFPKSRFNEVYSFVKGGLKDLSISRTTFDWGVDVPDDDDHIMYVWIDALTNYMTSCGFPDEESEQYKKFWSGEKFNNAIHVIGKDIVRFHAVYWPAFLMAAELPLPKQIVAHGWWTIEGEKISKSLGNAIPVQDLIDNYGLDQTRYFLLREVPFGNDGNFSRSTMADRINSDLAGNIGNLAQRTLSMIQKNCDAKVPEYNLNDGDKDFLSLIYIDGGKQANWSLSALNAIAKLKFSEGLESIIGASSSANKYIDTQEPWTLKKEDPERMATVLYTLAEVIRCIAIMLQPFTPDAAGEILNQLEVKEDERMFKHLTSEYALKPGTDLPKPEGVFPRLEVKEEAA